MSFSRRTLYYLSSFSVLVFVAAQGLLPAGGSSKTTDGASEECTARVQAEENPHARPVKGFLDCNRCHDTGIKAAKVKVAGVFVDLDKERWVTYREFPIWSEKDKHAQAYTVLLNDRSKKMGAILKTEVHRDKRCLACHTGFPLSQMLADEVDRSGHLVNPAILKNLDITFGVTCEGCHGPSGDTKDLKGWNGPHQSPDAWRFLPPDTKRKEYGFVDVRSPASRTKLCASCHIGSVEQERVVTHEMYAAGHPPLPAFEIESFLEQMPPHWAKFSEKSPEVIERFIANTKDPLYKDYKKSDLRRSQAMLVGELVSAGEYNRLIGNLTEEKHKMLPGWPELAVFDCYACHHELKGPSWRQARNPPAGIPGRPFLQEWNTALVKPALDQLGDASKQYDVKFEAVRQALNRQPFGERASLKKSTMELADWLFERAKELERKPVPSEAGKALFRGITEEGSRRFQDYDSARKLVWALQTVNRETKQMDGGKLTAYFNPSKEKSMLLLDLRDGREATAALPGEEMARPIIEVHLETVMPFFANYDPLRFRDVMMGLK